MTASIRTRLTLVLIAAGALLLAALSFAVYARARALLIAQFDDGLRARAAGLVALLDWESGGRVEFDYKGEFMPEFERRVGGYFFELWLEQSDRPLERSHSLGSADLPRFASADGEFRDLALADGAPARAIGLRVAPEVETERAGETPDPEIAPAADAPGAIVVVAGDTTSIAAQLRRLALELAGACAAGIVLIALIVRRTLAAGLAPLVEFSDLAARLDAGHLAERFSTERIPSELAPIAARLNDLLARLESAFARERRFSADVAHELRTPIAELRTLADVGATIPVADTETAAFFHDAREIASQMDATVSALLLIARCESGGQPIERLPVDIGQLVTTLHREYEPRACARGVALECHAAAGFIVETDGALFARLARILLANAVDYTSAGGLIDIHADARDFTITNGPTNLLPADMQRLGERFWRKDPARADSTHAGLGLALAAEIARLLGLRLTPILGANTLLTMRVSWAESQSAE